MDPDCWPQIHITWSTWPEAEQVAGQQLWPLLNAAEGDGVVTQWFFVRKFPHWRLRYRGGRDARPRLETAMAELVARDAVTRWTHGIYEPETLAFGGPPAMELAHTLFHADSRGVLAYLARCHTHPRGQALGRRELGVLLPSVLLRAAGLDWYEQADVWAKVAALRSAADPVPAALRLREQVHRLMSVNVGRLVTDGPLPTLRPWVDVLEETGRRLAALATDGLMERGTRAVLAHHVIFAWNRLGLPHQDQHTLSHLAREVAMSDTAQPASTTSTDMPPAADTEGQRHRSRLVDQLREQGPLTDERVDAALRAVPRHLFVPHASLDEAYADAPVHTKHGDTGASISCASQPSVVATMLQQLQPAGGHRVLEIGAGTGYNAALLAHLTAPGGRVTTIDVDDDIAGQARAHLDSAGITTVEAVCGDGAAGHPPGAPYDRITATVGVYDVPPAWLQQLTPTGRLVVPVRVAGDASRSIAFERHGDHWASTNVRMCTFMPLRDSGASDARRVLDLTAGQTVQLQANQDQHVDADALYGVLDEDRCETWTGVTFTGSESMGEMWLWLACTLDNALSRMSVTRHAIDEGMVAPLLPWGSMATPAVGERGLAYLTLRPADSGHEIGVIGHAAAGHRIAERMAHEVTTWNRTCRDRTAHFELHPHTSPAPHAEFGRIVLKRPTAHLVVTWQP